MDKAYEPHSIEQRWYSTWEEAGYFAPSTQGTPYCIMIPPPNVTGSLHMGHAFQDTLMDVLTRYQRMRGGDTLWQVGTDHAGIATQMVVERQLNGEGKTRHDLGREAFLDRVWQWKGQSGGTITRQLRRMGASVDWSRERFTMDDGLSAAVREVFVRLHDEGLIYRGKRLVNWDPVLHTAVSDLEVASQEEQGHLWHLRYPLASGDGFLVVATTRPETMLGDTAVAVNPEDERYKHLIGQSIRLPITHREIPIVGDDHADPAFGSGCVKITPAHDFNDYAVGQRHQLPRINIFDISARILPLADIPAKLHGLDRYEARDLILHDLRELDLIEKIDDHKLMVPRGDRTGVVIEPYLTDQWFVDLTRETQPDGRPGGRKAITEPALAAVREERVKFVPKNWENTYFQWLENIQDWCISRQIWWGHRIPAWYGPDGQVYVARSETEARDKFGLSPDVPLRQDEDVLDTWFSSALWPFSTLGWPEATPELGRYYPTAVLVTGFDIIFFWVARMIMMGLKFMDDVPFREVYIHGLVRDAEGQKMSKSKGNVLDPLDLIDGITLDALLEKRTSGLMQPQMAARIDKQTRKDFPDGIAAFGTDALRMTFASLASTGRDIRFDLKRVEGYRNFCNKLWNAARYVSMNVEASETVAESARLGIAERWIWSRFEKSVAVVKASLVDYRFDLAAQALYEFTWNEYCDWYLELAKISLQSDDASLRQGTRDTLVGVLESLLRALHPFMPFITEEIWQRVGPLTGVVGPTIMNRPYPETGAHDDGHAEAEVAWIKDMILAVRRIRGEMNIPPGKPLPMLVQNGGESERRRLAEHRDFLIRLGRIETITWLEPADVAPESATALVGEMKVMIPMSGLIDKQAELVRLDKELQRLVKERERLDGKLQDPSFIAKAPPPVVAKEQARLAEVVASLTEFEKQRLRIAAL